MRADGVEPVVARKRDHDLTRWDDAERLFADVQPELVVHLAAEVGGIGANRDNPGRYWYANLMMGAHVLEQARLHGTPKVVITGTVCSYPKFAPVPFDEEKVTRLRTGTAMGLPVHGYQIHHGRIRVEGGRPFVVLDDGSVDGVRDGRFAGTTLHGLFEDDEIRRSFLAMVAAERGKRFVSARHSFAAVRSAAVDSVADALAEHLDLTAVERLIALGAVPVVGGRT